MRRGVNVTPRHSPSMKIAVITPYYRESEEQLIRCIESVCAQTVPVTHFMIADGNPKSYVSSSGVRHISLDNCHNDYGNTPRAIGARLALRENFDVIGFLDADNWFDQDHLEYSIDQSRDVDFIVSKRKWVRNDRSVMPLEDADDLNRSHADTNCLILLPTAVDTALRWELIPKPLSIIGDRILYHSLLASGLRPLFKDRATVNYLCTWASFFETLHEDPPDYAKPNVNMDKVFSWWSKLQDRHRKQIIHDIGFELFPTSDPAYIGRHSPQ